MQKTFSHYYIIMFIFLIFLGMSVDSYLFIVNIYKVNPTFYEIVLNQTNNIHKIIFGFTYILILLSLNVNSDFNNSKKEPLKLLWEIATIVFVFLILLISANILISVFKSDVKSVFLNKWTYKSELSFNGLNPILTLIVSLLLLSLRFMFLIYLSCFLNKICNKKHLATLSIVFITIIDFKFYQLFYIIYPINILPIEHTRVTFTEALAPPTEYICRNPYWISFLYWIILIALIYVLFIIKKNIKQRSKKKYVIS